MHRPDDTELAREYSVRRYRELEAKGDRAELGKFIVRRFHERYFEPTINAPTRHGFTLMAIGCLVIEALECFYQGRESSAYASAGMFRDFFQRKTGLEGFGDGPKDWFYQQIRCAVLHQAETTGGWRLRRDGQLLDEASRVINAKSFVELLQTAVEAYAQELESNDAVWDNFRKKMDSVCRHCEPQA